MERDIRISTPENVSIIYEAANLGSRFIALFIDTVIKIALYIIIILVFISLNTVDFVELSEEAATMSISLVIIFIFLIDNFYNIFFELVMNGQTPGKKIAKIRVVSVTGEPVNFISSFIRNLMRICDLLPGSYTLGIIMILFTKKCQRLGDLAANTMVVKVRNPRGFRSKVSEILQRNEESETNEIKQGEKLNGVVAVENKAELAVDEKSYRILKKYLELRNDFIRDDHYEYLIFCYYNKLTGNKAQKAFLPYHRLNFLMDIVRQNAPYYD